MPTSSLIGDETMAKVAIIKGVEVKVGDEVAVTQWLTHIAKVVDIPRTNKIVLDDGTIVTKNRKGGWGKSDIRGYGIHITPHPTKEQVERWNDSVEQSETWMCM